MPVKVTYPNLPDDFRELVKTTRMAKGISMRRMAAALSVTPATVSQLELGDRNFSYYRAIQFRDYLDLDYDLPTPAPDASQKVTRNRKKTIVRNDSFFINVNGELIEVLTYRRMGNVINVTLIKGDNNDG